MRWNPMCSADNASISFPLRNPVTWTGIFSVSAIATSAHLRERRHPVNLGPAGLLSALDERAGRARVDALAAPLALAVVDTEQPHSLGALLPHQTQVGADDVAQAAVHALLEQELGNEPLARGAHVLEDAVGRLEDRSADGRVEVAERRRRRGRWEARPARLVGHVSPASKLRSFASTTSGCRRANVARIVSRTASGSRNGQHAVTAPSIAVFTRVFSSTAIASASIVPTVPASSSSRSRRSTGVAAVLTITVPSSASPAIASDDTAIAS